MSSNEKRMVAIQSVFTLCTGMSTVFLNIFLYAYTKSVLSMAVYTIFRIAMYPAFFLLAGKLANHVRYSVTLGTGLLMLAGQLLFVLLMHQNFADSIFYVYLTAMIGGAGEGFVWLSFNTLQQFITSKERMFGYLSACGIFSSAANVAAPLLATLVLALFGNRMQGYIILFEIVLAVFIGLTWLAFQVQCQPQPQPFSLRECMCLKNDTAWRHMMISTVLFGIRDSVLIVLSGIMLYNAIGQSGSLYGLLLALFAGITIFSYYIYRRVTSNAKAVENYIVSGFYAATSTIVLALCPNLLGGLYYGIVNGAASAGYTNGYSVLVIGAMNRYRATENVAGRVIAKEIYLSIGRILGMTVILLISSLWKSPAGFSFAVVFVSSFAVFNVLYVKKYQTTFERLPESAQ